MDEGIDISMLLILSQKFGPKKGARIWAHNRDLQMLEEAQKKSDRWPRRIRAWFNCVDVLEENEKRSRERLNQGE